VTRKGQGYKLAEADPVLYHGVSKFDRVNGIAGGKSGGKQTYTQIFGDWLCDMAERDERLVAITPAMREGSGLVRYAELYPARYFDVGIAEQHALTFAAGLACEGQKPVVAIYSTFLQRAYDQLIHDIQIQNLPIVFAIDRAGLVGADGATHNGSFDLTYLRCLPNMTVMVPADENECRQMLYTAFTMEAPAAVRYPRGSGPGVTVSKEMQALPIGKGEIRRRAAAGRIAILAFGSMLTPALQAGEALDATVANMRFVKPLDDALVLELADGCALLVTVEENVIMGGAGSAVAEALQRHGKSTPVLQLGLPDRFIDQGDPGIQLAECGLNADGIVKSIRARLGE
jgi:1-deoxy-D-xylulose-5-phosphate synthase